MKETKLMLLDAFDDGVDVVGNDAKIDIDCGDDDNVVVNRGENDDEGEENDWGGDGNDVDDNDDDDVSLEGCL